MRDDVGAINETPCVMTEDGEFGHGVLEPGHHQVLVVDHGLPFASCSLQVDVNVSIGVL